MRPMIFRLLSILFLTTKIAGCQITPLQFEEKDTPAKSNCTCVSRDVFSCEVDHGEHEKDHCLAQGPCEQGMQTCN